MCVGIIAIVVIISFYIGQSLGKKEYFKNKRNNKDSYHRSMANKHKRNMNNMNNNRLKFKVKPNNANLIKNMTEEDATANGLSKETFQVIQDIFKNNEGPERMIDIIKNNPNQGNALKKFILKNSR